MNKTTRATSILTIMMMLVAGTLFAGPMSITLGMNSQFAGDNSGIAFDISKAGFDMRLGLHTRVNQQFVWGGSLDFNSKDHLQRPALGLGVDVVGTFRVGNFCFPMGASFGFVTAFDNGGNEYYARCGYETGVSYAVSDHTTMSLIFGFDMGVHPFRKAGTGDLVNFAMKPVGLYATWTFDGNIHSEHADAPQTKEFVSEVKPQEAFEYQQPYQYSGITEKKPDEIYTLPIQNAGITPPPLPDTYYQIKVYAKGTDRLVISSISYDGDKMFPLAAGEYDLRITKFRQNGVSPDPSADRRLSSVNMSYNVEQSSNAMHSVPMFAKRDR